MVLQEQCLLLLILTLLTGILSGGKSSVGLFLGYKVLENLLMRNNVHLMHRVPGFINTPGYERHGERWYENSTLVFHKNCVDIKTAKLMKELHALVCFFTHSINLGAQSTVRC